MNLLENEPGDNLAKELATEMVNSQKQFKRRSSQ